MEYKKTPFTVVDLDYEGRTMEGYASIFGNVDSGGDVVHAGAFRKTLVERGLKVRFLWQHDPHEPLGRPLEIREDERGLFVKTIVSDTARGRDALALLRDEAVGGLSIGYDAIEGGTDYSKNDEGETIRNLRELRLWEFSLCTFPMNEAATVTALKTEDAPSETKPVEETEKYVRVRVRDPGAFQEDSFRTITISADEGIRAVIGRLKGETTTTVQTYLFDAEKWTVERAKKWVEEHKKEADKAANLTEHVRSVQDAFLALTEETTPVAQSRLIYRWWTRDVFDTHIIAEYSDDEGSKFYRIPYGVDEEGKVSFAPRDQWVAGEYRFVEHAPGEQAASEDGGEQKHGDHEAGPVGQPPTSDEQLRMLQLETEELGMLEV